MPSTSPPGWSRRAEPGEILIGDATRRLVRDAVQRRAAARSPREGKDRAGRRLPAARRRSGGAGRSPAASTRRSSAAARARPAPRARSSGPSASAAATCSRCSASAGVGKSRLIAEFARGHRRDRPHAAAACGYGEGITFWPLVAVLKQVGAARRRRRSTQAGRRRPSAPSELFWAVRSAARAARRASGPGRASSTTSSGPSRRCST